VHAKPRQVRPEPKGIKATKGMWDRWGPRVIRVSPVKGAPRVRRATKEMPGLKGREEWRALPDNQGRRVQRETKATKATKAIKAIPALRAQGASRVLRVSQGRPVSRATKATKEIKVIPAAR